MPLKLSLGISNPSDASGCRLPHAMVIHRNATFFSLVECLILAMTSGQDVCGPTTFKGTPGINLQQIRLPGWVFVFFSFGPTFAAPVIVALCLSKPAWHLLAPLSYPWENSAKIGIGLWTFLPSVKRCSWRPRAKISNWQFPWSAFFVRLVLKLGPQSLPQVGICSWLTLPIA